MIPALALKMKLKWIGKKMAPGRIGVSFTRAKDKFKIKTH